MLAPDIWGDIVPIKLDGISLRRAFFRIPIQLLEGSVPWSVGKDAFLACSMDVVRSTKSQGFGKALCTTPLSFFVPVFMTRV